jgi:hypothetical protein
MIKEMLDLVPLLSGYSTPVRAIMFGLPPLYAFAFVMLKIFEPSAAPPTLSVDDIQKQIAPAGVFAVNVIVANPTGGRVNVTAANLELFAGARPQGGLSSKVRKPAKYVVVNEAGKLAVYSDPNAFPSEAQAVRPYAGSSYVRVSIPLQEQLAAGGGASFVLAVDDSVLSLTDNDTLAITLRYDGEKESPSREIKLK